MSVSTKHELFLLSDRCQMHTNRAAPRAQAADPCKSTMCATMAFFS